MDKRDAVLGLCWLAFAKPRWQNTYGHRQALGDGRFHVRRGTQSLEVDRLTQVQRMVCGIRPWHRYAEVK